MQVKEAIILAGGAGTRLQSAVPDLPKCLAPINGRAFVDYLIAHLQLQSIERIVFALGVKAGMVQRHLDDYWPHLDKHYSIETTPLGTGGAIKKAMELTSSDLVLVTNGDTLFKASVSGAAAFHQQANAACTIFLKPVKMAERYDTVEVNSDGKVLSFLEKQPSVQGLINAGSYLLDAAAAGVPHWPEVFSFETGFLQSQAPRGGIAGYVKDAYFIDIGIPEDYERALVEYGGWLID